MGLPHAETMAKKILNLLTMAVTINPEVHSPKKGTPNPFDAQSSTRGMGTHGDPWGPQGMASHLKSAE